MKKTPSAFQAMSSRQTGEFSPHQAQMDIDFSPFGRRTLFQSIF